MSKEYKGFYKQVKGNEGSKCRYSTRLDTYGCGCQHDCAYCYAKSLLNFRNLWDAEEPAIAEDGFYTTKEDVALYIWFYGELPDNFMTKKEARELGWEGGGLDPFAKDMCIGGDRFGNYEGILPDAPGRSWTECDIDTMGASSRGAKRIVFSNDGLIYYTDDHYESFTLLYGED